MGNEVNFGDKFVLNQEKKVSKLVDLVIKYSGGLVKDEKQANYALLAIAAFVFFITFMIIKPQSSNIPDEGEVTVEPMPGLSQ